ncbi:hypothetical protein [Chryseobacterium arthrosphaerae]|uniref:hypothetical protein n=1 Tax=Chryseobacterium arthrosphaerae TaxID=651561 RepID=UPI001E5A2121|nr:hypothetical protein [Chryseobacterium arthrosphaerae]UEQ75250.1 hypothetical protein J8N07_16510 [Chryseobacterium arthrosphaerae]
MNKERIIQHLENLSHKYKTEIAFLEQLKKKPTNLLHQNEIDININFYSSEIKDIEKNIRALESI